MKPIGPIHSLEAFNKEKIIEVTLSRPREISKLVSKDVEEQGMRNILKCGNERRSKEARRGIRIPLVENLYL